jgi:hypothetical protein
MEKRMAMTAQPLPLQYARERRVRYPKYYRLGPVGLISGAVIVVCMLSLLFLAQTGRVATRGYILQDLQREHEILLREYEQYEYRIAAANRLDSIEARAIALGMRPAASEQRRYATITLPAEPIVAER